MQATQTPPTERPALTQTVQRISPQALAPGDILLSCGTEALSILIKRLDGGGYSHAAVWDGAHAVDATAKGVVRRDLQQDVDEQWYLDAYRWHSPSPGDVDLGTGSYPYQPVITRNDAIVAAKTQFAYDELLMAGLVIAVSKVPDDESLRAAVRMLFSRVLEWVHEQITRPGTSAMTCAETVAVSFDEAEQSKYEIEVDVDPTRDYSAIFHARPRALEDVMAGTFSSYEDLRQGYADLIASASPGTVRAIQSVFTEGDRVPIKLPPGCVTPRDLRTSPNLRFLGRLSPAKPTPPAESEPTWRLLVDLIEEYLPHKPETLSRLQ